MIKGFKSGKWYRYTKKGRGDSWNSYGEMDFILDGKPHQCNEGSGLSASFFDSPTPRFKWSWYGDLDNFEEVKGDMMNKTEAIKRLDALDKEAKALREIIEKGDKLKYDRSNIYVAIIEGDPYILVGNSNADYYRWHYFGNHATEQGWAPNHRTGQAALDYVQDEYKVHAFSNPKEGIKFFYDEYLKTH